MGTKTDGSSEQAFAQSLTEFKEKLSPARQLVFGEALKDIWVEGTKAAEAEQGEYTAADYYRQVDGLVYEQVVTFTIRLATRRNGDCARAHV